MIRKELFDARWRLGVGALVIALFAVAMAATYEPARQALESQSGQSPGIVVGVSDEGPQQARTEPVLAERFGSYDSYVWWQWSASNSRSLLVTLAVVLGAGLIASEAPKGTLFFLLSRPVTRAPPIASTSTRSVPAFCSGPHCSAASR